MTHSQKLMLAALAAIATVGAGCAKKKVATVTPPAPAPVVDRAPATARTTPAAVRPSAARADTAIAPSSRYPDAATRQRIDQLLAKISDAYFDYDRHALRADAIQALQGDSAELRDILKNYPSYKLTVEGFCDERGSAEYNLGLGDARAKSAKDYLVQVGIPADQLAVLSYGKEKQVCEDHTESCWQKNRRIHIAASATP